MKKYLRNITVWIYSILTVIVMSDKVTYMSIERPIVRFCNQKFIEFYNTSSRRRSRSNPVHYLDLEVITKVTIDNRVKVDFYFYEWLTNQYKRSFVEMHYRFCNLVHKDPFFGPGMRQGEFAKPCPYPPGKYTIRNATIPPNAIPRGFPFTKGRIFVNVTHEPTGEVAVVAEVDMELRQFKVVNKTGVFVKF